jgi:hypothetical protein
MIRGVNGVAVGTTVLLGLVTVGYVRIASGPSQFGPNPIALLFLVAIVLIGLGGTILPWRTGRIGLLAATAAATWALGVLTFSVGLGLMLAALLAAAAVIVELSASTGGDAVVDYAAAVAGMAAGLAGFGLTWLMAVGTRGG